MADQLRNSKRRQLTLTFTDDNGVVQPIEQLQGAISDPSTGVTFSLAPDVDGKLWVNCGTVTVPVDVVLTISADAVIGDGDKFISNSVTLTATPDAPPTPQATQVGIVLGEEVDKPV